MRRDSDAWMELHLRMSPKLDSLESTYSDQLTDFESTLRHTMDDESLLQDVFQAIRALLKDHRDSETDIRKILNDRFEAGHLREETYRVVQRMLDNIVSDFVATYPGSDSDAEQRDFAETDVIPENFFKAEEGSARLQTGSVLRDRFLLQKELAGGSMGKVYKALDRRMAEVDEATPWVAIKVLTPKLSRNANALRAMQQEAAKGRCLAHPNIVRFIDLDRDDDLYFLVMEWIEGRSLAAILDDPKSESLDLGTSLEIIRQVGEALDYAHSCGVVHADVKPGNLMVMPDATVKLIDFGVARIRQQEIKSKDSFDPGVLGAATPAYSSMQVLTGEDPVPADDVFSLGCLFYRLVAGHRVFGPRNAAEAAEEGMVPQRPADLNEDQWRALKKALSFSRVARYPTPRAFLDDLLGRNLAVGAAVPESSSMADEAQQTPRWPVYLGLVAAALLAVYFGWQTGAMDRLMNPPTGQPSSAVAPTQAGSLEDDTEDAGSRERSPNVPVTQGAESMDPASSPVASPATADRREPSLGDETTPGGTATDDPTAGNVTPGEALAADSSPAFLDGPAPTHVAVLSATGQTPEAVEVVLREDGAPAVVEFTRDRDLRLPLSLRLEEIGFSGNRSPLQSGQYQIENDGVMEFAAGQARARLSLVMLSDPVREADRQVDLVVRETDDPDRDLARLAVTLEDDEQRAFEAGLPPNTIGFATSQVAVREADPAVQIDLLRFNPDSWPVDVEFIVQDVTAAEGSDYFAPRVQSVSFAPGQRSARVLIPLVQDSEPEQDEAFFLEIDGEASESEANIFRRIAVMIRDDDS